MTRSCTTMLNCSVAETDCMMRQWRWCSQAWSSHSASGCRQASACRSASVTRCLVVRILKFVAVFLFFAALLPSTVPKLSTLRPIRCYLWRVNSCVQLLTRDPALTKKILNSGAHGECGSASLWCMGVLLPVQTLPPVRGSNGRSP